VRGWDREGGEGKRKGEGKGTAWGHALLLCPSVCVRVCICGKNMFVQDRSYHLLYVIEKVFVQDRSYFLP
jgi:hypothetical protein